VFPLRRDGQLVDRPLVDHFLDLAAAVGCSVESRRLELATTDKDELSAERVWHNLGLRVDGRVAILNSGSANGVARFWPKEYFAELARRLVDRLDHDVLVLCGPMERQLAGDIVRQAGRTRVRSMAAQPLDIGTAKACIRRGRFMVSTDSGPRHLAAAFGKPVITLRGPTLPVWSENPTVQAIDLRVELDCIGCRRSVCPRGDHRCMSALSVDLVYKKVVELIDRTSPALETEPTLLRYPRRRAVAHRRAA
jgi:heptosyltransferase-2